MSINGETIYELGVGSYVVGDIDNRFNVPVIIKNYTSVAHGLRVIAGQHAWAIHKEMVTTYPFDVKYGVKISPGDDGVRGIEIGNDVWIGSYVSIMDGIKIGDGAIIGACAVITKDVPPYAIIVGNPAIIKKYRYSKEQIKALLKIKWWDWELEKILTFYPSLEDVNEFIKMHRSPPAA